MLMDENELWETFGLKKNDDCNFLKALITFDKKCEAVGVEKLLEVWMHIVHIYYPLQLGNDTAVHEIFTIKKFLSKSLTGKN